MNDYRRSYDKMSPVATDSSNRSLDTIKKVGEKTDDLGKKIEAHFFKINNKFSALEEKYKSTENNYKMSSVATDSSNKSLDTIKKVSAKTDNLGEKIEAHFFKINNKFSELEEKYKSTENNYKKNMESLYRALNKSIDTKFKEVEKNLTVKDNTETEEKYSSSENIKRSIEFLPEYHISGISILQNFVKIFEKKYMNSAAKVVIVQDNLKIKMTIIPPNGEKEEVESYFYRYGLAVNGAITPEEFSSNPKEAMELRYELKIAKMRIETQREQLELLGDHNSGRISKLESDIQWFRDHISKTFTEKDNQLVNVITFLNSINRDNKKTIKNIIGSLERKNSVELEKSMISLEKEAPKEYRRVKDFFSNLVSGIGANAPTWSEAIIKILPL